MYVEHYAAQQVHPSNTFLIYRDWTVVDSTLRDEAPQYDPDDPNCTVTEDGKPRRPEDCLYQNDVNYYGRLGNYNSRDNSVEYDDMEAGPSSSAVRPAG